MKLHYFLIFLFLLPPFQMHAAGPVTQDFAEIALISVSAGSAIGGTHYALKPESSDNDRYRGTVAIVLGVLGIMFYKQILGIAHK